MRHRRVVGCTQGAVLNLVPQPEQMLAADADFASELRGGFPLAMPRRIRRIWAGL
jgi:hypothetical protein